LNISTARGIVSGNSLIRNLINPDKVIGWSGLPEEATNANISFRVVKKSIFFFFFFFFFVGDPHKKKYKMTSKRVKFSATNSFLKECTRLSEVASDGFALIIGFDLPDEHIRVIKYTKIDGVLVLSSNGDIVIHEDAFGLHVVVTTHRHQETYAISSLITYTGFQTEAATLETLSRELVSFTADTRAAHQVMEKMEKKCLLNHEENIVLIKPFFRPTALGQVKDDKGLVKDIASLTTRERLKDLLERDVSDLMNQYFAS